MGATLAELAFGLWCDEEQVALACRCTARRMSIGAVCAVSLLTCCTMKGESWKPRAAMHSSSPRHPPLPLAGMTWVLPSRLRCAPWPHLVHTANNYLRLAPTKTASVCGLIDYQGDPTSAIRQYKTGIGLKPSLYHQNKFAVTLQSNGQCD